MFCLANRSAKANLNFPSIFMAIHFYCYHKNVFSLEIPCAFYLSPLLLVFLMYMDDFSAPKVHLSNICITLNFLDARKEAINPFAILLYFSLFLFATNYEREYLV